jgi:pseudouridine kinase
MAEKYVVVVGGANTDVKARSTGPVVPSTSNPGTTTTDPGGVGRNIAENIARLGTETHLVSAVGTDTLGDQLLAATQKAGVHVDHVRRSSSATGTYTAVLDHAGELVVAVADMTATLEVTPQAVEEARDLIAAAGLVVIEGNLAPETVVRAQALAHELGTHVVIEPVSVPKARTIVLGRHPVHTITPNADELAALTGLPTTTDGELAAAMQALHARDVAFVWVRLGKRGSLLSDGKSLAVLDAVHTPVVDVTGAGDAMTAAYVHALVQGASPAEAAQLGHRAAALTVASSHTVRPDIASLLKSEK